MVEISSELIKKAVYEACYKANICLSNNVYTKLLKAYNKETNDTAKERLKLILQNAKIAYERQLPLCQDTGQVIVFLKIGQNVKVTGDYIEDIINEAVENCYRENFFRKSTVTNAVFNRTNTKTNTPCIIYTTITKDEDIEIKVLIKGAGSENKSQLAMLLPTSNEDEIVERITKLILEAGVNACPPMFIGIGINGTADRAMLSSKEALIQEDFTKEELDLAEKIKQNINKHAPKTYENCYVLDVKLKTAFTHIACMPVGITINCHSDRFSFVQIKNNEIISHHEIPNFIDFKEDETKVKEINAEDIAALKNLKEGESALLTGEIYVARDMAHKKLFDLLRENNPLPIDIKNKIVFYAGPCPNKPNEITGSIGPTTAGRMDKYAKKLYEEGIFATMGKGSRSEELTKYIKENHKKYFTVQGGIAALLAQKVEKSEIIAFDELGTEAIYKIYVKEFPIKTEIA